MVNISIAEQAYKVIESWNEMELSTAAKLNALCRTEMPSKLQDYYSMIVKSTDKDQLTIETDKWFAELEDKDTLVDFPSFYGKAIACISNVPQTVIDKTTRGDRAAIYQQLCHKFVIGIMFEPIDWTPRNITSFTFDGIEYFLPESKEVLGRVKPFFDRSIIEFTEAADLELASKQMASGKYHYASQIIAIICRPRVVINPDDVIGSIRENWNNPNKTEEDVRRIVDQVAKAKGFIIEPYNEAVCLERSKLFDRLTMDIVFEVFFCLTQHTILSQQLIAISSMENLIQEQKELLKNPELNPSDGTHGSSMHAVR